MPVFSRALLAATYKNGTPRILTEEHAQAEHHRFKTEYLFKNEAIPKDLYVSRLLQHFLIIKTIETQLQNLSKEGKSEISAFFALSYLEHLWRCSGIEQDLRALNVAPDNISKTNIAKTTENYLDSIAQLTPKALLAHFLLHVAGFMHGGAIICAKYIKPSNRLTAHQITTHQYDFSSAASVLSPEKPSPINLYQDMMKQIDKIELNDNEYAEVFEQCKQVYTTMASIYEDLCNIHTNQPKLFEYSSIAFLGVSMVALTIIFKLLYDTIAPMMGYGSCNPC